MDNPQTQQTPPIGGYPPMTNPEIFYRTLAGVAPVAAHMFTNRRYPTIGANIAGLGTGLMGAFGGAMAQDLAAQRTDPVAQQLRVAQQLQDLGTRPLPPTPLPADTQFAMPVEGQPTIPSVPLTPPPGATGYPTFNIKNIPQREQIAFAKDLAPLQQMATAEQNIAASKAQEAYYGIHGQYTAQQTEQAKQKTIEDERQKAANDAFRTWAQNPANRASPTFASDLAVKQVQLGADDKVSKPIIDAMGAEAQIKHYSALEQNAKDTLALRKIEEANLAGYRAESLRRGDIGDNMRITNDQLLGYDKMLKEMDALLKANDAKAKVLVDLQKDPTLKPDEKKAAIDQLADIKTARKDILKQYNEYEDKRNAADTDLKNLRKLTKTGQQVEALRPPPPPGIGAPGTSGGPAAGALPGQGPKTLMDFIRIREEQQQKGRQR